MGLERLVVFSAAEEAALGQQTVFMSGQVDETTTGAISLFIFLAEVQVSQAIVGLLNSSLAGSGIKQDIFNGLGGRDAGHVGEGRVAGRWTSPSVSSSRGAQSGETD